MGYHESTRQTVRTRGREKREEEKERVQPILGVGGFAEEGGGTRMALRASPSRTTFVGAGNNLASRVDLRVTL